MVFYVITLVPLSEDLQAAETGILSLFYADDVVLYESERRSDQLLNLLLDRRPYPGYLPETYKLFFISDTPNQEEAAKRKFVAEGVRY